MRAWGLAKGLSSQGVEVTIAINAGFNLTLEEYDGIKLIQWQLDSEFIQVINSYDTVIASYCMGDVSVFIADHIRDDAQLILDVYVPIYIEVSARNAQDITTEYQNYMADLARHNHTLRRGDFFLYANPAQELLYTGVLAALGIINPASYHTKRLIHTPFGLHREKPATTKNPYRTLGITRDDFVVLWFGGLYPWFRVEEYLEAIKRLSCNPSIKFVFVGGKNPFNPNPDMARQYDTALEFATHHKLIDRSVFFVDWIDYDDRVDWFSHADIIVSLNQPGEENKFSWRTRVIDFVWGETATITNGGDPLSDEMVQKGAAMQLDDLSATSIEKLITAAHTQPKQLQKIRKNVQKLKATYYWDTATAPLARIIDTGTLPYNQEASLRKLIAVATPQLIAQPHTSRTYSLIKNPAKLVQKVRTKGIRKTARVAFDIIAAQTHKRTNSRDKQFVFISHPIDHTGAPSVLLQMIEEYVDTYGAACVRVITPGITQPQENYLKSLGIKPEKAVYGASFRFIRLQLGLHPDDFVLINTIAIYDSYRDFILTWLKLGRLKHAHWFIHEDPSQIPAVNPVFSDTQNLRRITSLANSDKLSLLYPSQKTADEYAEMLSTKGQVVHLRVDVPSEYTKPRVAKDFDTIHMWLSGTSSDGRKGQVLALSALQYFVDHYYTKNPSLYRNVHLSLLSVRQDDYISQQIRWLAASTLSKFVTIHDTVPKPEAMQIASQCNTVLCCSINETFGLYIAEGMTMGHIVLRNNSSGVDEQLLDGKNGYLIDHTNIQDIARAIEKIANKKTSNKALLAMSKKSQSIIASYTSRTYTDQIND